MTEYIKPTATQISVKDFKESGPYAVVNFLASVAHICYGAPNRTNEENEKFVLQLIKKGHFSIFEHIWFNTDVEYSVPLDFMFVSPFMWIQKFGEAAYTYCNLRSYTNDNKFLLENLLKVHERLIVDEFVRKTDSPFEIDSENPTLKKSPLFNSASFKITCSRSCSKQFMRHRWPFSYAERSQRSVLQPDEFVMPNVSPIDQRFIATVVEDVMEDYYALAETIPREDARAILPEDVSTTFVATAPIVGWNHFVATRGESTDNNHPQEQIKLLANQIKESLQKTHQSSFKPQLMNFHDIQNLKYRRKW